MMILLMRVLEMNDVKLDGPIETLVVEDNKDDAQSVKRVLESHEVADFRVRSASTLKQGKEELRRAPAHVVMLDLHLPDAQGVDLVKEIKEAAPDVCVIVVTGWPANEIRAEAKAAGAAAVLQKPVDPSTLAMRLQYAVLYHRTGAREFKEAVESTLSRLGTAIGDLAQCLSDSGRLLKMKGGA